MLSKTTIFLKEMVKSNYKQIGEHIRLVDERNKGLRVKQLLGLSISKEFIPSVANIIGTDMENYKIIRKNQFACSTMQVRRDKKMPIALLQEVDEAIISQAYPIFEVKDEKELLPEYLMMWFRRPEFDRYARFKSHGSAREIFDWDEMQEVTLPIPHITKQKEIVKEYNSIQNRIKLNEQLIQKLEETAQAIYREWFVEGIDLENLKEGWSVSNLSSIATYLNGLAMQKYPAETEEYLPVLKIRELTQGCFDSNSNKGSLDTPVEYVIKNGDVIFSWSGTLKVDIWSGGKGALNQHLFKVYSEKYPKWFYYLWTKHHLTEFIRIAEGKATSLGHIKREHLVEAQVLIPSSEELIKMTKLMKPIVENIELKQLENQKLTELKELLLSKLATVEN
jgi:type I restriction enzyme S subunit